MKNLEVCVQITIKPTEASVDPDKVATRVDAGQFRLVLKEGSLFDIDALEAGVLETSYETMRDALAGALEGASRDRATEGCGEKGEGCRVVEHGSDYRVDGEVGRFRFGLFDVVNEADEIVFAGHQLWPARQGRQWYPTTGFKELALLTGATQRSYRQTVSHFNRSRHQEVGGTPLNSLRDGAEREGGKVIEFLDRHSEKVLSTHQFDGEGRPEPGAPLRAEVESFKPTKLSDKTVNEALASVEQAMRKRGLAEELIEEVKQHSHGADYEQRSDTVNIGVDDVGVKEQKAQRVRQGGRSATDAAAQTEAMAEPAAVDERLGGQAPAANKRPTVHNTVAQIERPGQRFTLTGTSVAQVLRFVLAFLLTNALLAQRLRFFTDGQRSLQGAILTFFSWHPAASLLLDWFHLVKKFKEGLSLACRGREIRNRHLQVLLGLLWFGLLDRAQDYLRSIAASELKDTASIERLIGYLERNRSHIPCYALRSQLGLPNSSNPVERANNLVTSKRQKHHGMSWSKQGSYALTALSAVVLNGVTQTWVRNRVIPFKFLAKAA